MKRSLLLFILIIGLSNVLSGQCSCTNCPLTLPPVGPANSIINISGASNPTLGQNGQDLKAVHIHMVHDAVDELDIQLIAPDGSSVLLSQNTGWSIGQNITFDICFIACNETAMPDPGFPANFDSQAGYQQNMTYTGVYYPSVGGGCFEDLTGDVNGNWELSFLDNVGLDGGTLFDWSLEFYDNSGLGCPNVCNVSSCEADGGDIMGSNSQYCEGDPNLNYNFTPSYPGSPPDPAQYSYTYVISDATDDVIIEYTTTPDLTAYAAGDYQICGLSYLTSDLGLIPPADGSYTTVDLANDIANNVFCADISVGCETVSIVAPLADPVISGPAMVCEGETVTYEITNYDPNLNYNVTIPQGSYGFFNYPGGPVATVEWLSGPGQICFETSNICGTFSTCVNVTIDPLAPPIQINGNDDVCPGVNETYVITPPPGPSETYVYTVTGGNIISQTSDEVVIDWFVNGGNNTLCVNLQGSNCPPQTECFTVNVEDVQLPSNLNSPAELCINGNGSSFITPDPEIISYNWYGTGITITNGQGTNAVDYTVDQTGIVSICLEVETDCGFYGPVCDDITVSPPPQPVIDPFGPTCDLSFTLSASITSGNNVNWTQIAGPPGVSFNPSDLPTTDVTVPEPGNYTFVLTETSSLCSGYDTIDIEIFESPEIGNISFDCTLDEYTVTFDINGGTAPYQVNGNNVSGNTFTSMLIPSGTSFTFLVTDANGCSDEITDSYTCPCLSDAGTMAANLLEICADENEIAYAVHNGDDFPDGNDIGMFFLHDSPNMTLGTIYDQNFTGQFTFQPGMNYGQVYYISYVVGNNSGGSVDLNDPCLSVSVGQPVIFYEDPTITLTSQFSSCDLEFPLSVDVSNDVLQLQWEQVNGPGFSTFTDPQAENTFVTVTDPGVYTYRIIAMNAACADTVEFQFEVYGPPQVSNFQENCSSLDEFILTFTVNGSGAPYMTDLPGTFNGNVFTSDTLNTNETYSITVTDATGCSSSFSFGPIQCDCISEAGNMSMDSILLCETDDSIHIDFQGNQTLDGDDVEGFVIHSGSSNLLVDPVFITTATSFGIPDTLISGKLYYISHIVGNNNNGLPDLNDACLDVAQGQPLYIYPLPDFSIPQMSQTCDRSINIAITNGNNGIATILSNSNNASVNMNIANSSIQIESDDATHLSILYEESNARCSRQDTFSVEFLSNPAFVNIQENCIGQSYYFSFEIEDGTAPYILNGDTLNGSVYTSDTFPSGTVNTFVVEDMNGCLSDSLRIEKDCSCLGDVGRIDTDPIQLCDGASLDPSVLNLRDSLLEAGDTLIYVIHNGSVDSLGEIIATSSGEVFPFDNRYQTNTSYFITVLTGDIDNGGIDYMDPCLDQTEGVMVQWMSLQDVNIQNRDSSCINDTLSFTINASGNFPFEIYLSSDQGRKRSISLFQENTEIDILVSFEREVWQIDSVDADCPGNIGGEIEVIGVPPQEVSFNSSPELCNNEIFGSELDLNSLLNDPSVRGSWSSQDITINGSIVDFDGADAGSYSFSFSTIGFEGPCPGSTYQTTVEVIECECPQLILTEELDFCNTSQNFDLDSLITLNLSGVWTLNNINQLNNPPTINEGQLQVLDRSSGVYELVYTITDSLPSQCQDSYSVQLTIEQQFSSGTQDNIPVYCQNSNEEVDLYSLLSSVDPGGIWTHADTTIGRMIRIDEYESGINEFFYMHTGSNLCQDVSTKVRIEIAVPPQFMVQTVDPLCFGDQNGRIIIDITESIYAPHSIILNGEMQDSAYIDQLTAGTYEVAVVNNKGCRTEKLDIVLTEPEAVQVDLGDDISLNANEEYEFTATTNIPDSALQDIHWESTSMVFDNDGLSLTQSFSEDDILTIRLTDSNGCSAEDQISININESEIYIPNVFRPTSDNKQNQRFGIAENEQIEHISWFRIFDRWGDLLYNAENISADSDHAYWDGTINGQIVPVGVYVYSIKYISSDGKEKYITGDVTLLP